MRCFTLTVGDMEPRPGIRLTRGSSGLPELKVGNGEHGGVSIPMDAAFAKRAAQLDQEAQRFPECRDVPFAELWNADILEEGEGGPEPRLISRPWGEQDRRVLVYLRAPTRDESIQYMGGNKLEQFNEEQHKVYARYPKLEDVVGIELVAASRGEALVVMHPGSAFRAVRQRGSHPRHHAYMLTTAPRPFVVKIKRKSDQQRGEQVA